MDLFEILVIVCECDKSRDLGEYLDNENCKCRKKMVNKLVKEYTETVEEVNHNENKHKCSSFTLYIVLFSIIVIINNGIGTYFVYLHWHLKKDVTRVKFGTSTQTKFNELIKLVKNRQKNITRELIFTTLDTSQLKKMMIVKIFTV